MPPTFTLLSPETGTDYHLFVHAPDPVREPGPWPAVLFLDGDAMFADARAAYHDLRRTGAVPPLLLVGVGYGATFGQPRNRRGRDYTPVAHSDEPGSGGGDAFLRFLTGTLWPELGRRHPLAAGVRGIAGHSLGSLLVLHALFQRQPFFTHHLASAPSIWWAERDLLRQVAALRAAQDALPARLFLSVGAEDSASMTEDLALLERQLATTPFRDLTVATQRFPGKNHYNVLRDAFAAGLVSLYGGA
ncbi:alpha/beta hydrolase [Oleiharenicola sp. Vm1]|uniref:alpha/beta hydrolase n=1 Tax=Oleiharenicola sp. Vm1 TaxID=3398393 RepID=UPI0039F45DF6